MHDQKETANNKDTKTVTPDKFDILSELVKAATTDTNTNK